MNREQPTPAELEKYYEEILETFSSPGWKHIAEDIKNQLDAAQAHGWELMGDPLERHAGGVLQPKSFVTLPDVYARMYEQMKEKAFTVEELEDE